MSDVFKGFKQKRNKLDGVSTASAPPKHWLTTGNYVANKVISGRYDRGYACSRMTMVTGPSSAGKSLMAIAAAVEAQKKGYGVFIVDSEHALDDDFMKAVGLDVDSELFMYNDVKSLAAAKKLTNMFIEEYRSNRDHLPPFVLLIDSLDQLKTKSHVEKQERGDVHNDQGQHAKQLKQLCSDLAHEIRDVDIFGICTKQPYKNQDLIMSKVEPYIITEAMRFPFSQILLLTNRKMRDAKTKNFEGINLKVYGYKTRFCKPFQAASIEIPYDSGINPFSGILEVAESAGIVTKSGAWYTYDDTKFQSINAASEETLNSILQALIEKDEAESFYLNTGEDADEDTDD